MNKTLTFVAGLATGYVLGARAGHNRYEQIVHVAKSVSEHPTAAQLQTKLKGAVTSTKDAVASKLKLNGSTNDDAAHTNDSDPPAP